MNALLLIAQSVLAVVLTVFILIQSKGTGFGRAWGGGRSTFTRRGLEKVIFRATFLFTILFVVVSILQLTI